MHFSFVCDCFLGMNSCLSNLSRGGECHSSQTTTLFIVIWLREMNMVSLGDTCWRCLLHQKINIQVSDLQSTRNQPEGQLFFMLDMTWVVSYWSYYLLLDWFVISTSVILVNMLATDKLGRSISILPEVRHQSIK